MRRSPYASVSYSFGPGPATWAVKVLIWTNIAAFVATIILPALVNVFGLRPADVLERFFVWQTVTYMFLHGDVFHILFNMLALWMFGVELERLWGTPFFVKYYFITGVGAAATTLLFSVMPFGFAGRMYIAT